MIDAYSGFDHQKPIVIKAIDEIEYSEAESNGYVYGLVRGSSELPVFVNLGLEKKYNPPERVKPEKGRKFINCKCRFASSEENLNNRIFIEGAIFEGSVILYYF